MKPQQASVELDWNGDSIAGGHPDGGRLEEAWAQCPLPTGGAYPQETDLSRFSGKGKSKLAEGSWHYNGSSFHRGRFLASQEGSIIALIPDQSALINNPRPGA